MKKAVLNNFARSLRRDQTDAEKKLWRCLRSRRFQGFKFRRQQPLGSYIADFCSFERKIVIELDGGQHNQELEKDELRTKYLQKAGFRVVRIWNDEFLTDAESSLEYIFQRLNVSPSPQPSPLKGEGDKPEKLD